MAKKEAIRKKVLSCFFIMMILMSVMPTSIFASANSNITSNGLSTTQSTPQSNAESLKGGLHILSSDLTLTSSDLTLTRADYDMGIAVEDVSKIGRYTEATAEGKKLLYGYPDAGTSYTTIQIDGNDYCQNDTMDLYVTQMPTIIEDSVVTKWTLPPDVKVSQDLTLMQNTTRNRLTVTNNDHASHRVKIRYMFDTMLADVDGAPFRVPGVGDITTEREFINPVFDYWRAMDSLANPTLTSDCVFVPYNKPYKVQFAYWQDIKRVPFDYTITAGQSITSDTAVGMYWDLGTLVPGEIKEVIVYYGTAQGPPPPTETQIMIMNLFTEFDNYLSSQAVSGYTYIGNRGNVPFVDGQLAITITDPKDELVFETSSPLSINPDQTISPDFTYNLPVDAVGGVYTINATIYDAEHNVLDQREAAFSVTAIDLSISPENIVTSIGGSAEYAITITNPSDIAVQLNLSLTGLDDSWCMLGKESLILNAGEEETVILNVTIPESLDNVGEYSFNVFAGAKSVSAVLNVGLEPIIYELSPPNNVIMSSNDVIFSWKTSVNSTTDLYIKQETEADFTQVSGDRGLEHSVIVENLTRNVNYIWHISSCTAFGCAVSEHRTFYIDNGIVFTQDIYEFSVERDYDQHCFVSVKNMDSEAHDLLVRAFNPYDDLYFGFIGGGSADQIISLDSDETKEIELVIHAQDAMLEDYTFAVNLTNLGAENITDYALVHVNVRHPHIDYDITEVSTDPITLSKTIRITNRGDPVTDLSLTPDEKLKGDVIIQPSLAHCSLETGESVDIVISPIWSEGIRYIHGTVAATVADESRELSVDYSCGEGKEMYEVTLNHPILYYDLRGAWCINCHHVEDIFNLPPGFVQGNVVYAYICMELAARSGQTRPYNVYIAVNGHSVGTLSNTFPRGYYEFDIDSSYLNYATAGTAENRYTLDTDIPGSYMTPLSNVRVALCLDELKLHICAESAEQAEEIAWSAPYIHKPSGSITVNTLSPEEGSTVNLNQPVLIKAEVLGDSGREKRCAVKATFSCCDEEIALVDNGLHDDGQADDGVYANTWIPGIAGSCEITVSASDCASTGYDITAVTVNTSKPDLTLTQRDIGFKNSFRKVRSNNRYLIEGKLTNITATIHNLGSADAKDVIVCFYDEHPSSGEVIGSTTIPQLSSRTTENVSISWNPTPVGEHNITVVLDPDNLIPELNEANNNATQNVSVVSSLSINDTILMVDKNPMFDNGSSVINLTSSHEIVAVGSIINPIVSSNTTLDASIHVKISDISGNVIWQSLKTGKINLTVNLSSNDITLFIEPDSTFDISDNPDYYGIRTLELITIPSSEVIGVIDINRTIYISPYDLTTYNKSGTYFYRFSGGRTPTGDSPIGLICSPEFEQHFAYDASYNETTTTYDITIPVFVAHEELVGLTELAKKYPNAEVKIIPYTGDLGGMKNTIQWHVQNYRSRDIIPLIVGMVPHFHVEYHELKVSKAYKATYMSYAMACNINNEILWDGLDKQALVSDNFRSDEIAKPLIAGENPKYSKDSTQLGSIKDYPVLLLCREDLPLLQIAPTLSTKDVREIGSLQDNYTIYRVGSLVPIGHTYYVGGSGSLPGCSISLNPTGLSLTFGYGITLPIINQDVGLYFALIGGMQGISGDLLCVFFHVTGSLHDLLYDEHSGGICPACVTFRVADYLPFASLLNAMDEAFREFFTGIATGYQQHIVVGWNVEDYLEPSSIFTILETTADDICSSPQPVYYSVENVRETYPSSVIGVNAAMSAIVGFTSLIQFAEVFGFSISPTFTGSPEVLHYTGTVNDVNLMMLMDDIKNIEEHPFTYKISQRGEAEPPSGVVMAEVAADVFFEGMIELPTKAEIQRSLWATGDLRRNPLNKITRAYNSVRGKYPTLGKIKQSAIKKISSALGGKKVHVHIDIKLERIIDLLKVLNALGKFTATYAKAMDVATFSSQEVYYFGDPTTTGYDDPVNVASPKVLPSDFNITVASEPLTLNVLNSTFVFSNVTDLIAPNITMQIITSSYAPATGYPQIPMITLAIQSPVNQVIGSIDVTLQNPTELQNINLPMTVINTGNETMPGIIAGNITSWPLQKWLWGSETHDNITYTVVYLLPFEYDMGNHLGTYYGTIDVVMKTEFVSITTGTEVEIESYPNIVSMGPDSEVPIALRVYNDYSSTSTVTNITVTAELPQNLIVLSTDGSTYNNSGGSLMINWDIPSLTTDAYDYCKNLHLNVKSPSIITDLMTASINVSVEYTAEDIIRQENLIVPIILVPADLVDVEIKSITVPIKMSVNNTYKLRATVKNSGKKTIAMVPVRLFLNDVIIATETIHYLENGENYILDFDFKPEHVGRYKVSVAVVQVPSEVNITNNVMTHECWVGEGLVLFDESHNEIFSIAPNAKYSYSKLGSLLNDRGYEAKTLDSMPITKEKLTNCSIFVISAPTKPFDTGEINAIREFVSNNGSLLLLNEWGGDFKQGSNLNEIAKDFGISFNNDLVNDPTDNYHSTPSYALIHEFSRHSITKGINEFLYPAGCSLIANNFSIARADDDSYTTLPKIPIQALAEEERGAITVLAATNFEGGRVVCIGDGDFCGDLDIDGDGRANIDEYDNKKLALNIVEWLARAAIVEPPVASFTYSPPKSFTNQTITFDASSSYDPDGTITKYEWDFGDGRTGTGKTITHTYSSAGNYTASLTVTDKDVATGTSSKVITVDPQTSIRTPIQTSIQLQTGWNLISLPIMPDDTDVLDVMNPVDGNWNSVWSYEAGNWKGYDFTGPSFLNDLTIMEPRKGYWIDMKSDDTLYVSGSEPTVKSISLTSGWNLVGYNSLNSMPTMSAMNSVAGNWNSVWSYEAGNWEGYDLTGPSFLNDLTTMEPGKGYWIDMKSSDTWTLGA